MNSTLDASALSPTKTSYAQAWWVCLTASLFFFYEFIQLNLPNAIADDLLREFAMTGVQLSNFSANYLYGDMLFLLIAGVMLDRISAKKLILIAMAACTASTLFFAFTNSLFVASAMRFIQGIGAAFCFLSAMKLATRWFPARRLALITGVVITMAMLGGVMAQTPMVLLSEHVGWRQAVFYDGLLGIVLMVLIAAIVQDYPENAQRELPLHETIPFWQGLLAALSSRQNWLGGLYTALLNLPIMILGALWSQMYLVHAHSLSQAQASVVSSMLFFGTIIGSPTLGRLSDKIHLRRLPMQIGALLSLAIVCVVIYTPHLSYASLLTLFFLLGYITSTQVLSYPLIAESSPAQLSGTALGFASTIIMGSAGFAQPLFGALIDLHWNGELLHHIPNYSIADYRFALSLLPLSFTISLIASYFIKETYCKALPSTS